MSWIDRIFSKSTSSSSRKANVPEGVWTKCTSCEQVLYREELKRHLEVCPKCGHHMRIDARERLLGLLDQDSVQELAAELEPKDILKFKDLKKYKDRISAAQKDTGEKDALIAFYGTLYNMPIVAAASNFSFMGGSMGSVVGAKFVKAAEKAIEENCPFVCFSASGGARMQEALFSLMQMAKTSAVLAKMREKLPEGFQRSEFLLEKGAIDMIVKRADMRNTLASLVSKLMNKPSPFVESELITEE